MCISVFRERERESIFQFDSGCCLLKKRNIFKISYFNEIKFRINNLNMMWVF